MRRYHFIRRFIAEKNFHKLLGLILLVELVYIGYIFSNIILILLRSFI